jgi:hypothetical protein
MPALKIRDGEIYCEVHGEGVTQSPAHTPH